VERRSPDYEFVGVDTWPINTPGWRSFTDGLYLDDPSRASGLGGGLGPAHDGRLPGAARVPDLTFSADNKGHFRSTLTGVSAGQHSV
jgi:hypothetical protein